MLQDYEMMVKKSYAPIFEQYNLKFVKYDSDEFFLIGDGFALYIFVDRKDRYADEWYVSLDHDGLIRTHSLMYIYKNRFTASDRAHYGTPKTINERIQSDMLVGVVGLLNHCRDILSGDKQWLRDYPSQGVYSRHVAQFLAPYFQEQGYYVLLSEGE